MLNTYSVVSGVVSPLLAILVAMLILGYVRDAHKKCGEMSKKDKDRGKTIEMVMYVVIVLYAALLFGALVAVGSAKNGGSMGKRVVQLASAASPHHAIRSAL